MAALRRVARVKLPAHRAGPIHSLVAARVLDSTFWLQFVPSARCSSKAAPSGTAKTEPSGASAPPSTDGATEKSQWVKAIDPANGLPFWYNKVTMEHRDKEPEFAKYDDLKDSETPADVKLVRGTDGRMWESWVMLWAQVRPLAAVTCCAPSAGTAHSHHTTSRTGSTAPAGRRRGRTPKSPLQMPWTSMMASLARPGSQSEPSSALEAAMMPPTSSHQHLPQASPSRSAKVTRRHMKHHHHRASHLASSPQTLVLPTPLSRARNDAPTPQVVNARPLYGNSNGRANQRDVTQIQVIPSFIFMP